MNDQSFKINIRSIAASEVFADASRDELAVLLAVISTDGRTVGIDEISSLAHTSKARTVSAIALWREAGVIGGADEPRVRSVTEEFPESFNEDDIEEESSEDVASEIRDENLSSMLVECSALMEKPALSTQEIKTICVLNTQYALSPEYITTLAAHLASKGKLTAVRLKNEGKRLCDKGIDNLEMLEHYICERESESADEWELRKALGIYNRNLTPTEKEYFKKWSGEFGYSIGIITLAFDVTVASTGKLSCAYMDKLITAWHAAGCKTLEECRSANTAYRAEKSAKQTDKAPRGRQKSEAPKPRYGDFDVNEAFKHALSRSFTDDE